MKSNITLHAVFFYSFNTVYKYKTIVQRHFAPLLAVGIQTPAQPPLLVEQPFGPEIILIYTSSTNLILLMENFEFLQMDLS